jgi:Fe2+ transport system protein FeoA
VTTICAELESDNSVVAIVDGVRVLVTGHAPALELCRTLIDMGVDPDTPLEVFRGTTLAITVRSIGTGAQLRVVDRGSGPLFEKVRPTLTTAPPIAPAADPLPPRSPGPNSHQRARSEL